MSTKVARLLSQLIPFLGRESAQSELRWMQEALTHPPQGIPAPTHSLEEMVERRARGEPLQYILGSQPFGPLHLLCRPPVLIPRPETEDWTIRLAELIRPAALHPPAPLALLDLCTGSGCIPLLLCHLLPPRSVRATGVDVSRAALRLARDNARLLGFLPRAAGSGQDGNTFVPVHADVLSPSFAAQPPYDVITANPPYIPQVQYDALAPEVRAFEDRRALLGDPDPALARANVAEGKGLTFYHAIARLVRRGAQLREGGVLALEVGAGQARDVAEIVERDAGLKEVEIWKDPWGVQRAVVARRK